MIKSINEEYCKDKDKIAKLEKLLKEKQRYRECLDKKTIYKNYIKALD